MEHGNLHETASSPDGNAPSGVSAGLSFFKLESCDSAEDSDNDTDSYSNRQSVTEAASPSISSELADITDIVEDTERRRKRSGPMRVRPEDSGRSVPIRCHIEPSLEQSTEGVEGHVDTYAIVPSATPFCEVVRVALLKLGYSMSDAVGAKGWIQIKNWLPLSLDQIAASKESTVEDMLADVSSVVTLKIKMCSLTTECWSGGHVQKAILWLLQVMDIPQLKLAKLCGLPQPIISKIVNDREVRLGHDKCQAFKRWYEEFVKKEPVSMEQTKTRVSLHQDKEVPLLRSYFKTARYPDDLTLEVLSHELNRQPYREIRARITPKKLKIWFTRERRKAKFAEKAVDSTNGTRLSCGSRSSINTDLSCFVLNPDRAGLYQNLYLPLEDSNHSEIDPGVGYSRSGQFGAL